MNTETPSIITYASRLSEVGLGILITLGVFIIAWLVLRALVRHWRERSERLDQDATREIQHFIRRIGDLEREAQAYPPDLPEPYQTPARALGSLLSDGRRTHGALAETLQQITSEEIRAPDHPVASVVFGFWQEPAFWFGRVKRLKQLHDRIQAAVDASLPADALLRDLRAKPLETAHQAQALEQALGEASRTLDQLIEAGLHGETMDEQESLIRGALAHLNALPAYFIEGTDSQIVRQATDEEVTRAWQQITRIESQTGACAPTVARWWDLHSELGKALDAADQAVTRATEALEQTHPTLDVRTWAEKWAGVRDEMDAWKARYTEPTVEDLERIDHVDAIIEQGLDLCSRLAALEKDRQFLNQAVPRYRDQLDQAQEQLRQLSGATRYPLSHLPLQGEIDALDRQAMEIGEADRMRTPTQWEAEAEAAQTLLRASQTLVEKIAEARESRNTLISLIGSLKEDLEPDFNAWAEALHARTSRHAPTDWSSDLKVTEILADAQALEARRERWVPADPAAALPTDDLSRRVDEIRRLIEEGLRYQRRLDRITERLQAIHVLDRDARESLDSAYQALDRLALRAADVAPPLNEEQSALRSEVMDLLERGYKLDLAFDPPTQGRAEARAAHVQSWLADSRETLETWMQSINRELKEIHQDLDAALQSLTELAPLSLEPAVQETHARLEAQSVFEPLTRDARAGSQAPHLVALSESLGDRLRTRSRLYQTTAFLQSDVIEALAQPREAWGKARQEAERQMRNLLDLEQEAQLAWLPLSCDTPAVETQMSAAYSAEAYLSHHGETVPQVIARLREATRSYAKAIAMAEARHQKHMETQAYLERRINDIDDWQGALERYRKANEADPTVVAAVRARLEEIESAIRKLSQPHREEDRLVSPEEAKRRIEHIWEQARRDLPLGAGYDVIPMRHIERGW